MSTTFITIIMELIAAHAFPKSEYSVEIKIDLKSQCKYLWLVIMMHALN